MSIKMKKSLKLQLIRKCINLDIEAHVYKPN